MKRRREKQPPPYLDGRLAGNAVSMQRSMRTPAGRFMQFFLCVMMLMAFSVQKASAYDDWNNKWISQWYDPINATIVLDIRVYQSWGGGDDGHCGFIGDDGYLTVTVAGYGIKINGRSGTWNTDDDLEKYVKNDDGETLNKDVSVEWLGARVVTSNGKSAYYLKITVPLTQDRIGKDQEVYYNGKWWRRTKTATDQKVEFTEIVDTRYGCTPTIITNAYYGVKQNKPGYFIDWKKDGKADKNSIDRYGYYFICDSEGKEINGTDSLVGSQTSGLLFVPTERMSLDNFSDYKVKQKYTPSNNNKVTYSTLSDSYTRPAYPQVKEISADYNQTTRKVKVNWNLSAAPTQNCIEDNMVLTIKSTDKATNTANTTTQNIKYMAGKTAYSYEFDVPLGKSLNYEFSIKRSHTGNSDVWNNAFSKSTSLDVSTKHSNVTVTRWRN